MMNMSKKCCMTLSKDEIRFTLCKSQEEEGYRIIPVRPRLQVLPSLRPRVTGKGGVVRYPKLSSNEH